MVVLCDNITFSNINYFIINQLRPPHPFCYDNISNFHSSFVLYTGSVKNYFKFRNSPPDYSVIKGTQPTRRLQRYSTPAKKRNPRGDYSVILHLRDYSVILPKIWKLISSSPPKKKTRQPTKIWNPLSSLTPNKKRARRPQTKGKKHNQTKAKKRNPRWTEPHPTPHLNWC